MLQIIEAHTNWAANADVFENPLPQLASRQPIWSDMIPVNITAQSREHWSSVFVVNHTTVTDPTIWQPGFSLTCKISLLTFLDR